MGMIMNWLYNWANTPSSTPPKGNIIIEFHGKYWNGASFTKDREKAKTFQSKQAAWDYADSSFHERTAEDISLERK